MAETESRPSMPEISEAQVEAYLRAHPGFLARHPELFKFLTPPVRELGDKVADFQHYQLKSLQQSTQALQGRYEGLIDFCRDNLSVQAQVHNAALRLIAANSLEQLLEVLTLDLVSLFDLDVVRLCVESEVAPLYDTYYSADHYSGIAFIEPGMVDLLLEGRDVLLVADAQEAEVSGLSQLFTDCDELIASCALLRLDVPEVARGVVLAFGVRYPGRFHPGQAIDLLAFMAEVASHQLNIHLKDFEGMAAGPDEGV